MTTEWTNEMEAAVREAVDAPAKVPPSGGHGGLVLIPAEDYDWLCRHDIGAPRVPVARRPDTGRMYAVVPLPAYSRFKPLFEEDPITLEEQQAALKAAGLRAGWNDPVWDDFDKETAQHEPR